MKNLILIAAILSGIPVFTFAVVALGVLDPSVDLSRIDDKTYR